MSSFVKYSIIVWLIVSVIINSALIYHEQLNFDNFKTVNIIIVVAFALINAIRYFCYVAVGKNPSWSRVFCCLFFDTLYLSIYLFKIIFN